MRFNDLKKQLMCLNVSIPQHLDDSSKKSELEDLLDKAQKERLRATLGEIQGSMILPRGGGGGGGDEPEIINLECGAMEVDEEIVCLTPFSQPEKKANDDSQNPFLPSFSQTSHIRREEHEDADNCSFASNAQSSPGKISMTNTPNASVFTFGQEPPDLRDTLLTQEQKNARKYYKFNEYKQRNVQNKIFQPRKTIPVKNRLGKRDTEKPDDFRIKTQPYMKFNEYDEIPRIFSIPKIDVSKIDPRKVFPHETVPDVIDVEKMTSRATRLLYIDKNDNFDSIKKRGRRFEDNVNPQILNIEHAKKRNARFDRFKSDNVQDDEDEDDDEDEQVECYISNAEAEKLLNSGGD